MKIYCIFDKKAQSYLPPFMVVNDEINALRSVMVTVNSGNNNLSQWPEDFCLVQLGEFDSRKGVITQPDVKPVIVECLACVRPRTDDVLTDVNKVAREVVRPAAQERQL